MEYHIKHVVILGGGTAGWMSACYLAKNLEGSVAITVVEAPSIPRIGVGEATIPNLHKTFFASLGLREDEWMRACNASFKMGIKFINWRTSGSGEAHPRRWGNSYDAFYHIFGQLPEYERLPLSHYWFARKYRDQTTEAFDYACYKEPPALDANLAPCGQDGKPWTNYAWHFDAQRVADFLKDFAIRKLNVQHREEEMTEALLDERGFITALRTKSGLLLEGDLFMDCSGFRGLLINQAMREPFLDMSDFLLCDRAVATAIPHDDETKGIEPYTSAIAMRAGWAWKIPMPTRFGSGYVYSSRFVSQDQATKDFCQLWNLKPEEAELNHVRFRVGRNRRAWVKNCVSIGLSSCFLEPLESTGIYFITAALYQLVKHFPDNRFDPILLERYNREIETMFDDCRDFIQAHFYFSPRSDTSFWKANKELTLSENIREKIAMYRVGMPVNLPVVDESTYYGNFEAEFRNFWTNSNYYCIFAGLGFLPDHPLPLLTYRNASAEGASPLFEKIKEQQRELLSSLPTNYAYLCQLHGKQAG
ncbi:tryptophan 7-halogenase [Ktedonosporobacter rubrisoli]|uniref:Tryptophan 7-halogenase n=1 Tax=Ktedonosporobacter rubrisoli TaxID=2509675 RepID=A0A4P6JJC6_KTERU|nr:tryptophan halogenase family protein [Ktedonosporobacter rubrisoli]QBD75030.1 tryptophan 7-halogenase [Ktedonosporobacter rubrisoli]